MTLGTMSLLLSWLQIMAVGEAEALFEDSQMKQAVIKAIEHDNSTINKGEVR